jgi:hypothetical protein
MQTVDDSLVRVRQEWNGWHSAEVRVKDLQEIHWFRPPTAPRRLAHAYISCTTIQSGALSHHCEPGEDPHRLLVCVLKRHCIPSVYAEIAGRADAHGAAPMASGAASIERSRDRTCTSRSLTCCGS